MNSEWKIYHNPRCSKSRQALELLQKKGVEPQIVEYLKEGLKTKETEELIKNSKNEAKEFIRKKEKEFADYKNSKLDSASSVAKILSKCPKLLERPVVVRKKKSLIARPPELVKELF